MLARKSIELLFILKKENDLKQISQKMNLSDRAVRYEVENLNFYLKKFNNSDRKKIKTCNYL